MNTAVPTESESRILMQSHLKLLEICYYVSGGIKIFFISFFLIYVVVLLGLSFMPETALENSSTPSTSSASGDLHEPRTENHPEQTESKGINSKQDYAMFQWAMRGFAAFMGLIVLIGWSFGALVIYAGWCIRKRKYRTFVHIIGALHCLFIPYGTMIGVFSLLTLSKPEAVKAFTPSATPLSESSS